MIGTVRNAVRGRWYRARYVAQTEGLGTLARRSAAMVGVLPKDIIVERALQRPGPVPLADQDGAEWPLSVVALGPPAGGASQHLSQARLRQCTEQAVPAALVHAGEPWHAAAQLASVVLVQPRWWAAELPAILAEAQRLHQRVVADVSGGDAIPAGVHAVLVADDAAAPPTWATGVAEPPVMVVASDAPGQRLIAVLTGGAP